MGKNTTTKERIAVLEERSKSSLALLQDIAKEISSLNNYVRNHVHELDKRVSTLESGNMTRREKTKVYGSITVAIIMAAAAILSRILPV